MLKMPPLTKLEDHRKEDGRLDWESLKRAETANGERCSECGSHILFPKGYRVKCQPCARLTNDDGEVKHESNIRCPACGYYWNPANSDYYELFADGEHNVGCHECGHEFTITTYVSYSFKSPARLPEEDEPDDEPEDEEDD